MLRHKTGYIISWNFMSQHVVYHDYRGIPSSHIIIMLLTFFLTDGFLWYNNLHMKNSLE